MFTIDVRAIVKTYMPVSVPNPAQVDIGRIVSLTWLLFSNLHSIYVVDEIERQADFFAELLVAVEAQIDGR
jgi:hypothetical protein